MAVNKQAAVGVGVIVIGAGALVAAYYAIPRLVASDWAAGNIDRAQTFAAAAWTMSEYAALFGLLIAGGVLATADALPSSA